MIRPDKTEVLTEEFLNLPYEILVKKGAIHTAQEISQQPAVWEKISVQLTEHKEGLQSFLHEVLPQCIRVILTGAGSSAFIGQSLQAEWQKRTTITTQAIATTDLVSNPYDWLRQDETILLISFARSGNSPESVAAVELADQVCEKCFHLIITCNENGALTQCNTRNKKHIAVLPPETNDRALAMTSSYTGMLLYGLLSAKTYGEEDIIRSTATATALANGLLRQYVKVLQRIAELKFERAVFLGSGALLGTAIESHLKLQELTDGLVICKSDSFLGFRHGPKAVVNEHTLMVYLFSNDPYTAKYESDLVLSMQRGKKPMHQLGVFLTKSDVLSFDETIVLSDDGSMLPDEFLPLLMVMPAQLLGFYKSLSLGLKPDEPSASGAISRVVEGVKIYPLEN